jgi:hypothetical protein
MLYTTIGGGGGEFGGIDASMDPELAMALRVSMEEERARQEVIYYILHVYMHHIQCKHVLYHNICGNVSKICRTAYHV